MSKHGRALVAMSGGVDSSVAAAMLHEEGYEVVGITMKTWDYATSAPSKPGKQVGCCSLDDLNDARSVALRFGFAHFVLDIREEFGARVKDAFTSEYLAGRTPNPCVLCNTHIKWDALLRRADALGCETIATGHYARLRHDDASGRTVLGRGLDRNKDQSYVLWGMPQEHLARTRLPLGTYDKPTIREMAHAWGLDDVAGKPDSYEICFIPDDDYRGFLRRARPDETAALAGGPMVLPDRTAVGTHDGYPFYTVGQRHGLGIALGYPAYVTRIEPETNTVVVGPKEAMMQQTLVARSVNYVKTAGLDGETPVVAQVRSRDPGGPGLAWATDSGDGGDDTEGSSFAVAFSAPRPALTPGQAVVLYTPTTKCSPAAGSTASTAERTRRMAVRAARTGVSRNSGAGGGLAG